MAQVAVLNQENAEDLIRARIARILRISSPALISSRARLVEDLLATPVDVARIIIFLGEQLGLQISDAEAENLKTLGDIIDFVELFGPHGTIPELLKHLPE
jgi:acyl carrier protein